MMKKIIPTWSKIIKIVFICTLYKCEKTHKFQHTKKSSWATTNICYQCKLLIVYHKKINVKTNSKMIKPIGQRSTTN